MGQFSQHSLKPSLFARNLRTEGYEMIKVEEKEKNVALITLNRPKALNALCQQLLNELGEAFSDINKDKNIRCVVITGSTPKAFAAGADIKEMSTTTFVQNYTSDLFGHVNEYFKRMQLPVIAAVNGYALGGGCELAMKCDIIIAGEKAKFGQPEITLGTIPGIGGTQRLTRAIGKSKAMEMVLTGNFIDAHQAEKAGLVCRVVPEDQLLDSAMEMAKKIASFSKPVVAMAKEMVNTAFETTLQEGLQIERRTFHSTFALKDQKEGMDAFANKRKPNFTDE